MNNMGFTTNQPHYRSVPFKGTLVPSSHLSPLRTKCTGSSRRWPGWPAPISPCGPLPFPPPALSVREQRPRPKSRFHQTKLPTWFSGQPGLAPVLWPHFSFLITQPLAPRVISSGPDLISLQLRLICMAVNTGLTKLTNWDKSKGNLRPLETQKSAALGICA